MFLPLYLWSRNLESSNSKIDTYVILLEITKFSFIVIFMKYNWQNPDLYCFASPTAMDERKVTHFVWQESVVGCRQVLPFEWSLSWKVMPLVLSYNLVTFILSIGCIWELPTKPINCSFWFYRERAVGTNYFKGPELAHLKPAQWGRMWYLAAQAAYNLRSQTPTGQKLSRRTLMISLDDGSYRYTWAIKSSALNTLIFISLSCWETYLGFFPSV